MQQGGTPLGSWMANAEAQQEVWRQGSLGTTSSPDLFPIPAWIVEAVIPDEEKEIKAWVKLMVVVMNATYGGSMPEKVEGAYNKAQLGCVTGLRLLKREQQLTPLPELRARLAEGRLDYAGEPMCLMEELKAEKVVPCWPKPGEAGIQRVEDFVPEGMKELLMNPRMLLLPEDQWPEDPPPCKVRATQEEWTDIVRAGVEGK